MKQALKKGWQSLVHGIGLFPLDVIAAYSARATLFIIISFFPFMIMLLSLLQFLPFTGDTVRELLLAMVPDTIRGLVGTMIDEVSQHTGAAVLPVAAVTGMWSASTGILSLIKGLNAIYQRRETRNFLVVRGMSMLYTLIFIVVLVALLTVLVFGNSLYQWFKTSFPFLQEMLSQIIGVRAIFTIVILTLFFTLLYKTVPNRKGKWFAEMPGALFSASAWMGFSYLFSLYFDTVGSFSMVYGSLTTVVLLLIWLYACMYILFVGAQINVLLQNGSRIGEKFVK